MTRDQSAALVERADPGALGSPHPSRNALESTHFTRLPHAAFTLVELLIGMSLAMMIMAAMLSSYTYIGRNLVRLVNQQILITQGQKALAYFAQDVRMTRGIDSTVTVSGSRVSLTIPTASSTNTITYYFNDGVATSATINGTSVSLAANSLTRCVYNGSSVTSLTLAQYLASGGLTLTYYDDSGNSYTAATLSAGSYLNGIKQISLSFTAQKGEDYNGTLTPAYQVNSPRLLIRNQQFLQ